MKQKILASTALTAIAAAAGGAKAEEPVRLSIGGYYVNAAGFTVAGDGAIEDATRPYAFKQDVEVHFSGETTLDNGLTVGAYLQLEGQTSEDQIDSVYAYFSGGWGELRFGDTSEALAELCYLSPDGNNGIFGADSPWFNFSNAAVGGGYAGTNGTCFGLDDNSTKIVYFSPTFGGFHFAASYAPDGTEDTRNTLSLAGTRFTNNMGEFSEIVSLAATFEHDFNGVYFVMGGGGTWSLQREADPNGVDDASDYNAYVQVSYGGFTFGGATEWRYNFGSEGEDHRIFSTGISYDIDAWILGLGWSHGDYERIDGTDNLDVFALTAGYKLGPGIMLAGVLEFDDYDSDSTSSASDASFSVGVGTAIEF
jgi:outer membrane protein OmpU